MKNFALVSLAALGLVAFVVPASAVTFKDCNPSNGTDLAATAQNIRYAECVALNGLTEDAGPQYAFMADFATDRVPGDGGNIN